jgi:hypothetical protein
MNYNPEGKKRAGRPKTRWIDAADNDMRKSGFRNWRMELRLIYRDVVPLTMMMNYLNLCCFIWPCLPQYSTYCIYCVKRTHMNALFSPI